MLTKKEILNRKRKGKSEYRGVYFLIKNNEIVYVGKSENSVFDRIKSHRKTKDFDSYAYELIPDGDLEKIETSYIGEFLPKYNKTISDWNNFKQIADFDDLDLIVDDKKISLKAFILNGKLYVDLTNLENMTDCFIDISKEVI